MDLVIKDRVAVGDNKYHLTDLGGGIVQLEPAPDSVSEIGTPVNKALLQPLYDISPNVYNIDFDFAQGGEIIFADGQSAADLYSDISRGKPVIVTKNNEMFFVPTLLLLGRYVLTCNSVSGLQFWFTLGQSSASAVQSEAFTADIVLEEGTTGSWSFRKWKSGRMDAWGIVELTATAVQSNSAISGLSQITASCALPDGMLSSGIEYCELSARDYRIFGNMTSVSNVLWGRFTTYESFANSLTLNSSTIPANAMIIGRWE